MTLDELIKQYRVMANDKVEPYFVSDEELAMFFNEAEVEACLRGRLLLKDLEPIEVMAGTPVYTLAKNVAEVISATIIADHYICSLAIRSIEEMDKSLEPNWREVKGKPRFAAVNEHWLRLAPTPNEDDMVLSVTAYCLPEATMELDNREDDEPEIAEPHHKFLLYWVLYRAFSIPDSEFMDQQRADSALHDFTRHFGLPADKDLRRDTRENVPHHVEAFFV